MIIARAKRRVDFTPSPRRSAPVWSACSRPAASHTSRPATPSASSTRSAPPPRGIAETVRDAILANFLPERTRYYAVSSVGFAVGRDGEGWDRDDPANTSRADDGQHVLRHRPRAVNVLEAVIDLERALRAPLQKRER